MSLDVYLISPKSTHGGSGIFIRENGQNREITRAEWDEKFPACEPVVVEHDDDTSVYSGNITHNLADMADAAGIYDVLWRPDEHDIRSASQLIAPLRSGLERLKSDPDHFKTFNPPNGWGDYAGFVRFVEEYLRACEKYPDAEVHAWR